MFVIESIHVASESICVYTWLRLSWSLIIARVQRVIRRVSLGMQRGLGVETSFPSKNSPRFSDIYVPGNKNVAG